jgi:hypothetical protein
MEYGCKGTGWLRECGDETLGASWSMQRPADQFAGRSEQSPPVRIDCPKRIAVTTFVLLVNSHDSSNVSLTL